MKKNIKETNKNENPPEITIGNSNVLSYHQIRHSCSNIRKCYSPF